MNNSNMEFAPGMTDGGILGNYVTVISCRDANAEPFGMKGRALTNAEGRDLLLNILSGPYYLALYPQTLPVGYVADGWLEGNIDKPTFVDAFQDKYGSDAGLWMRRAKSFKKSR